MELRLQRGAPRNEVNICDAIRMTTSSYIDVVYVNENVVSMKKMRKHLAGFRVTFKNLERVEAGAKMLGWKVWG